MSKLGNFPRAFPLVVRRWRQFHANRGLAATLLALGQGVTRRFRKPDAAAEQASELWRNADTAPMSMHPFDVQFGTETSGLIWGEHLATGHRHDAWNTAYYGIAPSAFHQAVQLLAERAALDWSSFTFIDLGSGKGRAVMLASQQPFAAVFGVELAPQLHAAALENLARFAFNGRAVAKAEFLQADAAEFPWKQAFSGPILFFLYNPFARPVLAKFLERLHADLRDRSREAYLLYVNPELDAELTRHSWIEKLWESTIPIGDEDRLGDRFGSTMETVSAYRCVGF